MIGMMCEQMSFRLPFLGQRYGIFDGIGPV